MGPLRRNSSLSLGRVSDMLSIQDAFARNQQFLTKEMYMRLTIDAK
jgi:hypothetical protein